MKPCFHVPFAPIAPLVTHTWPWTIAAGASAGGRVKTYDIEVQRLRSMRHDKGAFEIGIDALVLPRPGHDDAAGTTLRLPVEHARALMVLLKQQFAELDKLQPRSRRSGRS
jgi:hypothetical protein